MKRPPTEKIWQLRAKLESLAERGIAGEADAAHAKLARLESRYDFTAPRQKVEDLFSGVFRPAPYSAPVVKVEDCDIANAVKWAIELETGIGCSFIGSTIMAQATPTTCTTLEKIAKAITEGFSGLWVTFYRASGSLLDRRLFIMGLTDGMLNQPRREGQSLPQRPAVKLKKAKGGKRGSVGLRHGVNVHPYAVALELGKSIRFNVPLDEINNQLETVLRGELAATN